MKTRSWTTGSLAISLLLGALAPLAGGGEPDKPPVFVETVRVNLVNVDAWVTTTDGAVAYGLRPEDFDVQEDGKPVTITNFSAPVPPPVNAPTQTATAAALATGGEPLTVGLLIDSESISVGNRNAVIERLRPILESTMAGERGRVIVATASPTLRVRQTLTGSGAEVTAALAVIGKEIATERGYADDPMVGRFMGGPSMNAADAVVPPTTPGSAPTTSRFVQDPMASEAGALLIQAKASAQQTFERARAALASVSRFLDAFADVPGRKVVCYVGNGIPINPGADTFNSWMEMFGHTRVASELSAGVEQERLNLGPLVLQVIGHANASRVTLLAIDTSTSKRVADYSAETRPRTNDWGFGVGTEIGRRAFLDQISRSTGGKVLVNSAELAGDFTATLERLESPYSLAFDSDHPGDGKMHTIEVKVKRGGTRVRYREGYIDKSLDDLMVDRSIAALYVGQVANPLSASLSLGTEIKQADGTYVVPVIITVPVGGLVLLPQGQVHTGSVSAWFTAADADGRLSQASKQTFAFKVPNQKLLTALSQRVSYPVQFLMRPGDKRVAASLRDDNGEAESTVVAQFTVPQGEGTAAEAHE
jgi:VWFA-related protein